MTAIGAIDLNVVLLAGRDRLLTISTVQTLDIENKIKGDNRKFNPPHPAALYLEEYLAVFAEAHVATGRIETIGRFEYAVMVPQGSGTKLGEALRTEIANAFRPDQSITGAVNLAIDRVERPTGSNREGGVYYALPVFVTWRAYSSLYTT